MNLAQRMTRWLSETGATVVLYRGDQAVTEPVPLTGWVHDVKSSRAQVVFGPYPTPLRADGVRVTADGAVDVVPFASQLGLPAGVTYEYVLTIAVR